MSAPGGRTLGCAPTENISDNLTATGINKILPEKLGKKIAIYRAPGPGLGGERACSRPLGAGLSLLTTARKTRPTMAPATTGDPERTFLLTRRTSYVLLRIGSVRHRPGPTTRGGPVRAAPPINSQEVIMASSEGRQRAPSAGRPAASVRGGPRSPRRPAPKRWSAPALRELAWAATHKVTNADDGLGRGTGNPS